MRVLKFGGGCLKDAKSIKKLPIILKQYDKNLIIVISAFGKLTNLLERAYETKNINPAISFLEDIMMDLSFPVPIMHQIRESIKPSPSIADILSIGEIASSKILSYYLRTKKLTHTLLNATKMIKTNSEGINASVNWEKTIYQTHQIKYKSPILTQGFISSFSENENFQITCLGREGSDYSAAIFGRIFNVEEVILFKDVDGIYTADPKNNPTATLFTNLTYDEAFNICNQGNTIIHPKTIYALKEKRIPILIKNFNNLDAQGTLIV